MYLGAVLNVDGAVHGHGCRDNRREIWSHKMKRMVTFLFALALVTPVMGQNGDSAANSGSASGSASVNTLDELWYMQDATPVDAGTVDLRFTTSWVTSSFPANNGDSDDDFIFTPSIVWGTCPNVELSFSVPLWLGDSGDMGPFDEGNYDTYVGMLWRMKEGSGADPSVALSTTLRLPTGDGSNGVDAELRLILSNEYDSGIRSHLNVFATTVNTDNYDFDLDDGEVLRPGLDDVRDFQWGAVIGLDGPLCDDGSVRWVADYMHRSSYFEGRGNMNVAEVGWEWQMDEGGKLGMSLQVGLDRSGDNPNFGATMTYSRSLTY